MLLWLLNKLGQNVNFTFLLKSLASNLGYTHEICDQLSRIVKSG